MQLNKSNVVFDQQAHTYHLNGVCLKGITGILSKHLFPKKYDNIPESVLKNAADRGHLVHTNCELVDSLGIVPDCEEAKGYIKLKTKYGLTPIANEYIVTDTENYASAIDIVFGETDSTVSLADIKTTYSLDEEYLSWQLSIYAYLFELQNPAIKVEKLYGIWLRKDVHKLVEVVRKPTEVIKELLRADANGEEYVSYCPVKSNADVPQHVYEVESYMCELDEEIKKLTEKKETLLAGLLELMNEHDVSSWKGNKIQLIRKAASVRESIDGKALKEKFPDIYKEFTKTSNVKGSITFKILNNE